ncbi:hypothetical protein ACFVYJ_10215 [Pontibacter sp. JAM-7]|uniref:hypothetical protein n=1 Tax=Pontibacter sp. JAM-7 TaxID=3366581 RepID=UPI003AF6685C
MHDITDLNKQLPSFRQLVFSTIAAAGVAATLLVVAILPAEYGVDPTGMGERLGMLALNQTTDAESEPVTATAIELHMPVVNSWREDRNQLVLMPGQGAELKAIMQPGDGFIYQWHAEGGMVHFDMHGQKPGAAANDFTRYWLEDNWSDAQGVFQASFAGEHGWYWENRSQQPVTITLSLQGYYDSVYMP